jgi:hypothetical protein
MPGNMSAFWNNSFHATFDGLIKPQEDFADEEIIAATIGGVVTAHLNTVAANPIVLAIVSVRESIIIVNIVAQINGTRRTTRFTGADEEEITSTAVVWTQELIEELNFGR